MAAIPGTGDMKGFITVPGCGPRQWRRPGRGDQLLIEAPAVVLKNNMPQTFRLKWCFADRNRFGIGARVCCSPAANAIPATDAHQGLSIIVWYQTALRPRQHPHHRQPARGWPNQKYQVVKNIPAIERSPSIKTRPAACLTTIVSSRKTKPWEDISNQVNLNWKHRKMISSIITTMPHSSYAVRPRTTDRRGGCQPWRAGWYLTSAAPADGRGSYTDQQSQWSIQNGRYRRIQQISHGKWTPCFWRQQRHGYPDLFVALSEAVTTAIPTSPTTSTWMTQDGFTESPDGVPQILKNKSCHQHGWCGQWQRYRPVHRGLAVTKQYGITGATLLINNERTFYPGRTCGYQSSNLSMKRNGSRAPTSMPGWLDGPGWRQNGYPWKYS